MCRWLFDIVSERSLILGLIIMSVKTNPFLRVSTCVLVMLLPLGALFLFFSMSRPVSATSDASSIKQVERLPERGMVAVNVGESVWVVTDTASLNEAIDSFNGLVSGAGVISITADITLTAASNTINNSAASLSIVGNQHSLSGDDVYRPLHVSGAAATIEGIILTNGFVNGDQGGGLRVDSGAVFTLSNSIVQDSAAKSGAGIYVSASTGVIMSSTISGNETASNSGGGVLIADDAHLTIDATTIFSNRSQAKGGGVRVNGDSSQVTITHSAIVDNYASDEGGGVYANEGQTTIVNATVSGNRAALDGGGIYHNGGTVDLGYASIVSNTADNNAGGGLYSASTTGITLTGVLLAYNSGTGGGNCNAAFPNNSYSLSSDNSCTLTGTGSLDNTDPLLSPLADNGGETATHALQDDSPAVDAGGAGDVTTDQRGISRPQSEAYDIGAYELACGGSPWVVNDTDSLDFAIRCYNQEGSGSHIISFTADITLTEAATTIDNSAASLEIRGNGYTLDGAESYRLFHIRLADVSIETLTMTHGYRESQDGGGILIEGDNSYTATLTISQSKIIDNTSGEHGGGLAGSLAQITLVSTELTGNIAGEDGGGIDLYSAEITVISSDIISNAATNFQGDSSGNQGGGIYGSQSKITLISSEIVSNTSEGISVQGSEVVLSSTNILTNSAGGVYGSTSEITVISSTIANNSGATNGGGFALYSSSALTLTASRVISNLAESSNSTTSYGGALYLDGSSRAVIDSSDIIRNTALNNGGAIYANDSSYVAISSSRVLNNMSGKHGGGVFLKDDSTAVFIDGSTFYGNTAVQYGGAIRQNGGGLHIENSTLSGNDAGSSGVLFLNGGTATIAHTTIVSNTTSGGVTDGGGVSVSAGHAISLFASLVAHNESFDCALTGTLTDMGYNLASDATCGFTTSTSLASSDPFILSLADNGGETETHALSAGSPAIDYIPSGDDTGCGTVYISDQRGVSRPQSLHYCSIGAVEYDEIRDVVATDDSYEIDENATLVVEASGVLTNDDGPISATLESTLLTAPVSGTVVLASDGSFVYTPTAGLSGVDQFRYVVTDTAGVASDVDDIGVVTITIVAATCFVRNENGDGGNGVTYVSSDGRAVQEGIDEAAVGDTLKIAGSCRGLQTADGVTPIANITKDLSLVGGYLESDWGTNGGYTTTLSGDESGRVVSITSYVSATLTSLVLQDGNLATSSSLAGAGVAMGESSHVVISDTTIRDNTNEVSSNDGSGGGLSVASGGYLTLTQSVVEDNYANGNGGALSGDSCTLVVTDTLFRNNLADSDGGAISVESCSISLDSSEVVSNAGFNGGGIYGSNGAITLTATAIQSNTAEQSGGGLYGFANSLVSLESSSVTSNTAATAGGFASIFDVVTISSSVVASNTAVDKAGGLYGYDTVATIASSSLNGNTSENGPGGAIVMEGSTRVTLNGSAVSQNRAQTNGGGIHIAESGAQLTLIDSLMSDNEAEEKGGALYQSTGELHIENSTLSGNSANSTGALHINGGSAYLTHTSVVGNMKAGSNPGGIYNVGGDIRLFATLITDNGGWDCEGSFIDGGYNLTTYSNCGFTQTTSVDNSSDVMVLPLADNGGETWTHALQWGSPAIDTAGSNSISTDQRGVGRPQLSAHDIGAYEYSCPDSTWLVGDTDGLNEAISCFNEVTSGTHTISFTGSFSLTTETETIENTQAQLEIMGNGYTLDGTIEAVGDGDSTTKYRLFTIGEADVSIDHLTMTRGYDASFGGGIYIEGDASFRSTLTLNESALVNNETGNNGGAIYSRYADVRLISSEVTDNYAGVNGGGIRGLQSYITLISSEIINNHTDSTDTGLRGGGINLTGSSALTLTSSLVMSNTAKEDGGGLYLSGSQLVATGSSISRNEARYGAGAYLVATVVISNSTVAHNTAAEGKGGLYIEGSAAITNSTISHNESLDDTGSGIYLDDGTLTLAYSSVVSNTADSGSPGLYANPSQATATVYSSILAHNTHNGVVINCDGTVIDSGYNLEDGSTCGWSASTSFTSTESLVGALADNNGATAGIDHTYQVQSHPLLADSPAVDQILSGTNGCGTDFVSDQRGVARPYAGNACSIGAVEYDEARVIITSGDTYSTEVDSSLTVTSSVLANDISYNSHKPLSATVSVSPSYGTVEMGGDGTFVYTPTDGIAAVDRFTYIAYTENGITATEQVTINVIGACYVSINDSDMTDYSSVDGSAIQEGVDAATAGDLLKIAGNCENSTTTYLVNLPDKDLTLRGGYTATAWTTYDPLNNHTLLDGNGQNSVIYMSGNYSATISGLIIAGGSGNNGGGIYQSGGQLLVRDSAIVDNNATTAGGGVYLTSSGVIDFVNTTIAQNFGALGGGVYATAGTQTGFRFSTITANYASSAGNGIFSFSTVDFANTIMATNFGSNCAIASTIDSGYNLDSGSNCGLGSGTNTQLDTSPSLSPFLVGALPVWYAISDSGPAVNQIPNGTNGCGTTYTTDQRGIRRPYLSGSACDIGAYEYESTAAVAPDVSILFTSPNTATLSWAENGQNERYDLYRSSAPYRDFSLWSADVNTPVELAIDGSLAPFFYYVKAVGWTADTADSNTVGVFHFTLTPGE